MPFGHTEMRLDPYFQEAKRFPDELARLREILLSYPLTEELKWRQPCYTFEGGNVVILHEMKDYCGLGFMRGALIDDPEGVLVAPGKNSQAARQMKFQSVAEIDAQEKLLRAIIESAIEIHKSGQKVDFKAKRELVYPDELFEKMAQDADFKTAFEALTPGRQRGYILHISHAKQSKTRKARIEKYYNRIMDGLGMHDR